MPKTIIVVNKLCVCGTQLRAIQIQKDIKREQNIKKKNDTKIRLKLYTLSMCMRKKKGKTKFIISIPMYVVHVGCKVIYLISS